MKSSSSTSSSSSGSSKGSPVKLGSNIPPDVENGAGKIVTDGASDSQKKTGVAWNIGIGGMYNIDPDFAVDVTYRYRDLGKVKYDKDNSKKLKSHNITVGVVYKF